MLLEITVAVGLCNFMNRPLNLVVIVVLLVLTGLGQFISSSLLLMLLLGMSGFLGALGGIIAAFGGVLVGAAIFLLIIMIIGLFCLIAAYGLWTRQPWALRLLFYVSFAILGQGGFILLVSGINSSVARLLEVLLMIMAVYFLYVIQSGEVGKMFVLPSPNIENAFRMNASQKTVVNRVIQQEYLISTVGTDGVVQQRQISRKAPVLSVGRSNVDLELNDASVSRRHAQFEIIGDGLTLKDLGSTNGTKVDGHDIGSGAVIVSAGSSILLGSVSLRISKV